MRLFFNSIISVFILFSCANPVTPPGGPKDVEAPVVVVQQPASGTSNYQGDRIELLFNEYINFQGGSEKVLITPAMNPPPKFILKGKKLIISLPDNLDNDITYSISLFNAVSDYTEGNPLKLYKYVFSRGNSIDSASLSGVVENSFDKQVVGDVFVGLFPASDTSAFINNRPIYIAPTNSQGQFKIDYVKAGDYVVAALEDKNFDFKLDRQSERISLSTNPISINQGSVLEQSLPVFFTKQDPQVEGYEVLTNHLIYIYFNQEIEEIALDLDQYTMRDKAYFNKDNDTLFYHWAATDISSLDFTIKLNGTYIDSLNIPLMNKEKARSISVSTGRVKNRRVVIIQSSSYIESIEEGLISLTDSGQIDVPFTIDKDKQKLKLSPLAKYVGDLKLTIDSGALTYFNGLVNDKRVSKLVNLQEAKSLSVLSLDFGESVSGRVMLELYGKGDKRLRAEDISGLSQLDLVDLKAGLYTIRVYQDTNGNGKWDTGDIDAQLPPEETLVYNKNVEIKENWDKELRLNF